MRAGRVGSALVTCFALTLAPCPALAQDIVAAEALFREGRALLEQGAYEEACRKLAESQRLDASSGTALNLASCHEHQGKLATAWAEYLLASRLARTQGNAERVAEAKQRASELEPQLSTLTIQAAEKIPGIEIRRDDAFLEASSIGSKIPVDPGVHRIVVSAPGHESVTLEVTIGARADAQVVTLPKLKPMPAPSGDPAPAPAPAAPAPVPVARRSAMPWVIGGAGAAFAVTGGVFGVLALTNYHSADRACSAHVGCSPDVIAERNRAGTFANVANVGVGLGLVGLGIAAALWFTSDDSSVPPGSHARVSEPWIAPAFGAHDASVKVSGSFQ